MARFQYVVDYDEVDREWDIRLWKDDWYTPYHVASFKDKEVADAVCRCIESLREEIQG